MPKPQKEEQKKQARLNLDGLSLKAIVEQLNKKYGENTLAIASEAEGLVIRSISTGIYLLDFCLGNGGIPENRITEFRGPFSSLKSTICNKVIANFQRKYSEGYTFFDDGEKSFDPKYAAKCGCDNSRIALINPDSGEQAIDVLAEVVGLRSRSVLGVVDSIASLQPTAEIEASMDKQSQGLHPRLINRMMRLLTSGMKRNLYDSEAPSITVLCTNQLREKLGVVYGNPETTPGGRGKDFAYSLMIRFASSKSDSLMVPITRHGIQRDLRFGQNVKFLISKNKVSGSQFEEGEFEYYTREYKGHQPFTFNNEDALFRFGAFYEIIKEEITKTKGKTTTRYRYKDFGPFVDFKFKAALIDEPKICSVLYKRILEAIAIEQDEGIIPDITVTGDEEEETPRLKVREKLKIKAA